MTGSEPPVTITRLIHMLTQAIKPAAPNPTTLALMLADRALRKDLSQVTGNTRTRMRGLRELWAETLTIALPDQEEKKPLGRPSGLNPVPGQTAPDHGQTAADRGQTAPDQGQTPDEPADKALRKDLSQVTGNTRTRLRGLRELWAETLTIALLDQEEEKPLGRPSGLNPFTGRTAPDRGQTAPDHGQTAPDRGQTAPDRGQTAPDRGQTAPDQGQTAPDQGQTSDKPADRALRKDLSQVTGNTRTRLRGLRELWAETLTIALLDQEEGKPLGRPSGLIPVPGRTAPDRGQTAPDRVQTAPDQGQTPDEPADRALRKDLSQVTGNTRTRLRGLRELWAETLTIALLDQEEGKPLGRPSGLIPVPGRTAPDRGQTAPDRVQTAPDQGQTPDEPADRALRKDLSQVTGNTRTRMRGLRELWAETLTIALPDQEEKKPLGRPSGLNPVPGQTAPDHGQTAADRGQTAPDQGQTPDEPADKALRKDLSQEEEKPLGRPSGLNPFTGRTAPDHGQTPGPAQPPRTEAAMPRTEARPPRTTARPPMNLEEGKPLGRPSGLIPVPGRTAPDRGQTAPDRVQTAPDQGQTPDEPADRALRKDLYQVTGNTRTRLRGLRELWAETLTIALPDQQEEKPLGRPSGLNPFPGQTAPDHGQTAADRGQTAPDRGQTAPDRGQTAPDRGQTAPVRGQTAPDHGQSAPGRGQTAPDRVQAAPDRVQAAPDRVQAAPDRVQAAPDRGQAAPDRGQAAPDRCQAAPDRGQAAPDRGQTAPDRGQTAPDRDQTAPDQGQNAPDRVQTAPDQGQTAPDLGQTAPDQVQTDQKERPLGRPSGLNPLGDIKTATQQAEGKGLRSWMHVL
ncbi:unnamed protein product [Gadus morhua 'NCC']